MRWRIRKLQMQLHRYEVTTQHPYAKVGVTAQIALDLFENKENTRSVLLLEHV